MNAPVFPTNPTVGQWFGQWVWNGARWVCSPSSGTRIVSTSFLASGPYQPSPGLVTTVVECWGGGGGGGSVTWLAATIGEGGGGGGSGGYSKKTLAAALVLGGVAVTVAGQAAAGANGTVTSFGAFCVANGGSGASGVAGHPGVEGIPGVGDLAFAGSPGEVGPNQNYPTATSVTLSGGIGGALLGGNSASFAAPGASAVGNPAWPNQGAGGNGGIINQVATDIGTVLGGVGGSGLCVVTEYCWSDTVDEDCGCGPTTGMARVARHGQRGDWGYDHD